MIAVDRRRSHSITSDRLRLYVNSSAIVCDRVRSRSQAIAGIEPCSIRAIVCNRVRSYVNKVLRSCDWNVSHNAMFSQRTMKTSYLSTFMRACVLKRWKVKLTQNSLWKKLENTIVCSIALAKNSKTSSRRLIPGLKKQNVSTY